MASCCQTGTIWQKNIPPYYYKSLCGCLAAFSKYPDPFFIINLLPAIKIQKLINSITYPLTSIFVIVTPDHTNVLMHAKRDKPEESYCKFDY